MSYSRMFVYFLMFFIPISSVYAGTLPSPEGKVILTISGNITNTNNGKTAEFDRAMLESLGVQSMQTSSPWYDHRTQFEGINFNKLMQFVGASGTKVTATALNDYVTTIPLEDFQKFDVLLAMKRDGQYMSVRDKGPLFIIYPFDSDPQLQSQTYYTRSAWQVARLNVE
ncbi:oxidoreductase [Pseudochrobactrum sp. MP213Fo]|uniref:oxidoreductase n=1 Tax=Pseudochrobactrum sp. MP213Fo TaxID=3022250 RepID=UPI003BA08304